MRTRLILSFLIVVIITILSMLFYVRRATSREINQYMIRGGMVGLSDLVKNLEDYHTSKNSWVGVQDLVNTAHTMQGNMGRGQMMGGGSGQQRLVLIDASGNVLAVSDGDIGAKQVSKSELSSAIQLMNTRGKLIGYLLPQGGIGFTPGLERPLIDKINRGVWQAALVGGSIALLISLLLGYWFLKPVNQLTKAAHALGKGDLSQRVQTKGSDELAQLGSTFNQMAESLQRNEESRKAMTADIAHELRTPLAVQRATVEAMLDGMYGLEKSNLQPLLEQNLLLTRLVEDMRILALSDAGELNLEKSNLQLQALGERVLSHFRPQADKEGKTLALDLTDQVLTVNADPIRLEQILTNLLSNALRHTPVSGTITLRASADGHFGAIIIHDSGEGIPVNALPYIFDRFYRIDHSRNREEGGSGLGLAIARQLARAHGGDLTARNHQDGGAEFTLRIPLAEG